MAMQESDKTGPVFIMSQAIVSVPNLKNWSMDIHVPRDITMSLSQH